jgi:hypothetical protein
MLQDKLTQLDSSNEAAPQFRNYQNVSQSFDDRLTSLGLVSNSNTSASRMLLGR